MPSRGDATNQQGERVERLHRTGVRELYQLLRSPWDTLHFACSTEYFPLTVTLSLREREQQASDWCFADGYWANSGTRVIDRRWTILPLPRGEGQGEGEILGRTRKV